MSGEKLAQLRVGGSHTVGDLAEAISRVACAGKSSLALAYNAELLGPELTVADAGLFDGAAVTAIRWPELFLAAAFEDGNTRVWSAETGRCERTLEGDRGAVLAVAFSPSGMLLATGCLDGSVSLWDVSSGRLLRTIAGHSGPVGSLACSPDGRFLATGSFDCSAHLWVLSTGERTGVLPGHCGTVWAMAFSPDGSLLATSSEAGFVKIWGEAYSNTWEWEPLPCARPCGLRAPRQRELTIRGHNGLVLAFAFSPDVRLLATCSMDHLAKLWDVQTGECQGAFRGHTGNVCSAAFSPDGQQLLTGSVDGTARLWGIAAGTCENVIQSMSTSNVRSVGFSPGGTLLAMGSADGAVELWGAASGEYKGELKGGSDFDDSQKAAVTCVTFAAGPLGRTRRHSLGMKGFSAQASKRDLLV